MKKAPKHNAFRAFVYLVLQALHAAGDVFPVHKIVQEVGQVVRARVAEIDVVGVLPNVATQQCCLAEEYRVHAILGLSDF